MIQCQSFERGGRGSSDTSRGWRLMAQTTSKTMQIAQKQKQRNVKERERREENIKDNSNTGGGRG